MNQPVKVKDINEHSISDIGRLSGIGALKIFKVLRAKNILKPDAFNYKNCPHDRYVRAGYFVLRKTQVSRGGFKKELWSAKLTTKGVNWLLKVLSIETND